LQVEGGEVKFIGWFLTVLALAWTSSASANEAVYSKPMYESKSKSYFELVRLTKADEPIHYVPSMNWADAEAFAKKRIFKGVHGRLAVIKSLETHSFIMMNFRPATYTWIGLRYFCKGRKLVWSDGDEFQRGDFQAWATPWDQSSGVGCHERSYMPVAYNGTSDGFRWIAKGGLKIYRDLLIEYPTGKP
jgi:hypothetical protein